MRDRTRARSIVLSFNYPLALDSAFASAVNIPHLSSRANCCTTLRGPVAYHNERVRPIYLPIISGILAEAHKSTLPAAALLATLSFCTCFAVSLSLPALPSRLFHEDLPHGDRSRSLSRPVTAEVTPTEAREKERERAGALITVVSEVG